MHTRDGRSMRLIASLILAAILAVMSLTIVGCSSDTGSGTGTDTGSSGEEMGTVRIGWIPWDEDVAATFLWKRILEDEGYMVELTQLDVAPVYDGVASGDLDLFLDAWLPVTHSDYWAEYGDQLEDLAIWYDSAALTIAVPSYVDADSLEDLPGMETTFDGQIIGIEPGSGLMRVTREEVVPGYGLDGYEVIEGSTPAMLAELDRATSNEEPIIVTLWRPHWAYSVYDIKDLEDPEGLLGEAEEIHVLGREGFSADFPELTDWIANFSMTDAQLASLENLVINEYGAGDEEAAVDEWLSDPDNQALVDGWLGK